MPTVYHCWGQIVMLIGFIVLPLKILSESNTMTPSTKDIGEEFGAKVLPLKAERKIYVDGTEVVDLTCTVEPSYMERMVVLEDFYFSRKAKEDKYFNKITEIDKDGKVVWFPKTESKWKKLSLMKKYRGIEGKVESKGKKNISATITLHIPVYSCEVEGTFRCFIIGIFRKHRGLSETKRHYSASYFHFNETLCDFEEETESSGLIGPRGVLIGTLISTIVVLFACICAAVYKLIQLTKTPTPTTSSKRKHRERTDGDDKIRRKRKRGSGSQNNPTPRTISNNAITSPCFTPPPSPITKLSSISHPRTIKMVTTSSSTLTTPLVTPAFPRSSSNMFSSIPGFRERPKSQFGPHYGIHQAIHKDTILEQTTPTEQSIPPPPQYAQPIPQPTTSIALRESTTHPLLPKVGGRGNMLHAALMKRRTRLSSSMHVSSRHEVKW